MLDSPCRPDTLGSTAPARSRTSLEDPRSGVQIAFVTGGVAEPDSLSGILSLGTIDYLPIWLFYVSGERLENLSQLKGKRIAVGPVGSGTRFSAEKILGKGGISAENATFAPLAGDEAAQALRLAKWMWCGYSAPRTRRPCNRCCAALTSSS